MPVLSNLFVVDADLARACSSSQRPPAPECMSFLDTLLDVCHRVIVSDELWEEWGRHTQRNAAFKRWLRRMFGRKKVVRCGSAEDIRLSRLAATHSRDEEKAEIEKDLHLVVVAMRHGARVASLDERARRAFARLSEHEPPLKSITWVNPRIDAEGLIAWLQRGAPAESRHGLEGFPSA